MACRHCNDINEALEIRRPCDLAKAMRVIKANLADGTLEPEPQDQGSVVPMPRFEELDMEGPWPDYLEYGFRCARCGQQFRLDAETYHGVGGRWRPA